MFNSRFSCAYRVTCSTPSSIDATNTTQLFHRCELTAEALRAIAIVEYQDKSLVFSDPIARRKASSTLIEIDLGIDTSPLASAPAACRHGARICVSKPEHEATSAEFRSAELLDLEVCSPRVLADHVA